MSYFKIILVSLVFYAPKSSKNQYLYQNKRRKGNRPSPGITSDVQRQIRRRPGVCFTFNKNGGRYEIHRHNPLILAVFCYNIPYFFDIINYFDCVESYPFF